MTTITARQRWQRAYSDARYWPQGRTRDEVLRWGLFKFFGPAFGRAFSAPFDRNIATASVPWYLAGGAPTPIAVYEPKGKADLATSYVNIVNPGTYDAAPGVAPTLDANGWQGNGAAYLKTGVIPSSGWSALCFYSNVSTASQNVLGARNTSRMELRPNSGAPAVAYGNGGQAAVAPALSSGVLGVAAQTGYRNGNVDTNAIPAWTGDAPGLYLMATNWTGVGVFGAITGIVSAAAIWDTSTNHATWMPAVMAAVALI